MDFPSAWKASSIVLTGAFGILGLVKNFKHKETAKITAWGYVSLAGIIFSTVLGVAAQLKENADDSAKALALAKKSDVTLREIERLLSPIDSPKLDIVYDVPCNEQRYVAFCNDVPEEFSSVEGHNPLSKLPPLAPMGIEFDPRPFVAKVFLFKDKQNAELYLLAGKLKKQPEPPPDLYWEVAATTFAIGWDVHRNMRDNHVLIDLYGLEAATIQSKGKLLSTLDFSGTTAIIVIEKGPPGVRLSSFAMTSKGMRIEADPESFESVPMGILEGYTAMFR